MMNGYDMSGWGWFGMSLMVIVAIAIVGLVIWVTTARRPPDPQRSEPSAHEQLHAQLASGKIDTREYRERLDALHGDHARS
jgi:putative membrane protein